jgi:hypothetical protein
VKECRFCGVVKPFSEFHKAKLGRFGYRSKCKDCLRPYYKEYFRLPHRIEKTRQNARDAYWRCTPAEKRAKSLYVYRRSQASPRSMLMRSLRGGLGRHPTKNPVTPDELMQIWENQKGRCPVSGLIMTWGKKVLLPTSISIDRKDPNKGYSRDNVRLICFCINAFRGRWTDDHVVEMARAIVAHADAKKIRRMRRPRIHLVEDAA